MSETFVPLVSASSGSREATFASLNLKSFPKTAGQASVAAPAASCAKPTVTLTRNGEIVSGIRIQCGCGEVIELNCIY
jgi:hypothetical protein